MHTCSCAQPTYQKLIQSEGMVEHLVRGLKTDNTELQRLCASAIFKVCHVQNDNDTTKQQQYLFMYMYM